MLTHRALGAQLLQVDGGAVGSLLYLSPLLEANAPARGGVPVLFPQFASTGPLPKHGMARTAQWGLVPDSHVHYRLTIADTDFPQWPHACALDLHMQNSVSANAGELLLTLQVTNTGTNSFAWTGGLHPYFAVEDLLTCRLAGLDTKSDGDLIWTEQPFEQLFAFCPLLTLRAGTHTLELTAGGFTEWMVWNPGASGACALHDLPDDDWRRFVCIEPVCVSKPVVLNAGSQFEGWLRVRSQRI